MKANVNADFAVSPVIGVMLMIVVTVIIAAIVSAFAGEYTTDDKKAPTAVFSCRVVEATGSGSYPNGGLLFTHESGEFLSFMNIHVVVSSGEETRRFPYTSLRKIEPGQNDGGGTGIFAAYDREMNAGNQFILTADNNGSAEPGGYLGWTNPTLILTANRTATFTLVDRENGQTVAHGGIIYAGE